MIIKQENSQEPDSHNYDIAIGAVGFETRCRHIFETIPVDAPIKFGLEFGFLQEIAFNDNKKFFMDKNFHLLNGLAENSVSHLKNEVANKIITSDTLKVLVDISSMSREMIAKVALFLRELLHEKHLRITIAYAPPSYPPTKEESPIEKAGPIIPELAGWAPDPSLPIGVVLGLGCEPGLALGSLQRLEPSMVWAFSPIGLDIRFDALDQEANSHIGDIFNVAHYKYDLIDPTGTRVDLVRIFTTIQESHRIIAVSSGPKIFAWILIFTALFNPFPSIGIWAFSSRQKLIARDIHPMGEIIWHNLLLNSGNGCNE